MLIGHWPLNGNTNDYSGYNNNGTPTNLTYSDGKIGQAGTFNGTTSYVTIANQMNLLGSWSFCVWLKLSASTKTYQFLAGNAVNSGTTGKIMARYSGKIAYSCPATNYISFTLNTDDIVGSWNHLSFIANGSGISLYLNGIYNSRITYTNPSLNVTTIGNAWSDTTWLTGGQINDVRIYDHALSEYEIKELAKAKILHYTFDDMQEPTTNIIASDFDTTFESISDGTNPSFYNQLGSGNYIGVNSTRGYYSQKSLRVNRGTGGTRIYRTTNVALGDYICVSSMVYSTVAGPHFTIEYFGGDYNWSVYHIRNTHTGSGWEKLYAYVPSSASSATTLFYFFNPAVDNTDTFIDNIQIEKKPYYTDYVNGSRTGRVNDYSGFFNHSDSLTEANTPRWTPEAKIGTGGYLFNNPTATSNYITKSSFYSPDAVTMSVWFKKTGNGLGTYHIPLTIDGEYHELSLSTTGNFRIGFTISGTRRTLDYSSATTVDGNWHMLSGSFDGTTIKSYIDGLLVNSTSSYPGALSQASRTVYIGKFGTSTLYAPNGYIDDVRIYATALSATDILAIYNKRANLDNLGNVQVNEIQEDKNLTPNPSFDIDSPGTIVPTGWTLEVNGPPQVVDIDGRRAVLFLGDGAYRRLRSTKYFSVTPGQTIYGRLWAKRMSGCRFYFGLYWGSGYAYFASGGEDNVWANVGGSMVIPAGVTEAAVWIFNYSGNTGALYIDDIFVSYDPIEINFADNMSKSYTDKYKLYPTGINMALEYDEVTGTANASAQQEIRKNGSLIINGEFSEVDL